jgi:hypothetical protein
MRPDASLIAVGWRPALNQAVVGLPRCETRRRAVNVVIVFRVAASAREAHGIFCVGAALGALDYDVWCERWIRRAALHSELLVARVLLESVGFGSR